MRRRHSILFALFLTFGMVAGAQDASPADPATTPMNDAKVRFLNAAPNAEVDSVVLSTADDQPTEVELFSGVAYGEMSDYVEVAPGSFEVTVNLATVEGEEAGGVEVPADTLDTSIGEYYTIVLMGVVRPDEDAQEDGGFFDWVQGLFNTDDDRFALRAMVINDLTQYAIAEDETEVRIVHAAPGTDAVDLVVANSEGANVIHSVGYGEVSGFDRLMPADGAMELRVAGSEAVILDLADQQLETGTSSTIYLLGTPVEEVPLEIVVSQNPVISTAVGVPATPGAVPPAVSVDHTWLRDSINEIDARLAAIEGHLRNIADVEGAQEDVDAALDEVAEAMALLNDARDHMIAQPTMPMVTEPDPAAPEDDGEAEDDAGN